MKKNVKIALVATTCVIYAVSAIRAMMSPLPPTEVEFVSDVTSSQVTAPEFSTRYITEPIVEGVAHVPSICELHNGELLAAWYAGSEEGAGDVEIFMSRLPPSAVTWSAPVSVVSRRSASVELCRWLRKVGNAVVFADDERRVWLVYVAIGAGGWAGSTLNVKISEDDGHTWSESQRLTLSSVLNMGELVKNKPIGIAGGGFALPIYHELFGRFPQILWLTCDEDLAVTAVKSRMAWGRSHIQPSIVPLGKRRAIAFLRDMSETRAVGVCRSSDGGATWSRPQPIDLPNPDAAVDAVPLSDGRLLLAFNDSRRARDKFGLAISADEATSWTRIAVLEDAASEGQYPYMIRGRDGRIHLVYSCAKKRIKHAAFNDAWLSSRMREAAK